MSSLSRRRFLKSGGTIAGSAAWPGGVSALVALSQSACSERDDRAAFRVLTRTEAADLEAIAARIMPTTNTPGARQVGVIRFIDLALDSVFPEMLQEVRLGLIEHARQVAQSYSGAERFSDLDEKDQDDYLRSIEETPFFGSVRFLTLCGFFSMSAYGGNKDDAGWKLLGMDPHQRVWQPPFGHYDAEYLEEEHNGG